jgi:ABC-type nickel/cobalt efflux system permease component RcnA
MAPRIAVLAALGMLLVGMGPALANAQEAAQDHKHHTSDAPAPATAPTPSEKKMTSDTAGPGPDLNALAKRMNAASGAAKVDAMADLLNALVAHKKDVCEPMMSNMKSMKMMEDKGKTPKAAETK